MTDCPLLVLTILTNANTVSVTDGINSIVTASDDAENVAVIVNVRFIPTPISSASDSSRAKDRVVANGAAAIAMSSM